MHEVQNGTKVSDLGMYRTRKKTAFASKRMGPLLSLLVVTIAYVYIFIIAPDL